MHCGYYSLIMELFRRERDTQQCGNVAAKFVIMGSNRQTVLQCFCVRCHIVATFLLLCVSVCVAATSVDVRRERDTQRDRERGHSQHGHFVLLLIYAPIH